MKRHPGLHPLSQHHHFALIQALELRRAAEAAPACRAAAVRKAAERFVRFWKKTGEQHFREEEEVLLPAYSRHARLDRDPQIAQMKADHAEIRAAVQSVEEALRGEGPRPEDAAELARKLHGHVRLEENEIFPRIEAALGEAELSAMGKRLTRLHRKSERDG